MRGYEDEWVNLRPGQHSVRYTTLPAGNYEFEVKYVPSIASSKEKMREREVEALYRPIELALRESDEPGKLQTRIQSILETQKRYQESQDKTIEADKIEVEKTTKPFMEAVMEVMEANYANSEFGVQELAMAMHMNRSILSKKLNVETGNPTSQFIRNYRLDIAKRY